MDTDARRAAQKRRCDDARHSWPDDFPAPVATHVTLPDGMWAYCATCAEDQTIMLRRLLGEEPRVTPSSD